MRRSLLRIEIHGVIGGRASRMEVALVALPPPMNSQQLSPFVLLFWMVTERRWVFPAASTANMVWNVLPVAIVTDPFVVAAGVCAAEGKAAETSAAAAKA